MAIPDPPKAGSPFCALLTGSADGQAVGTPKPGEINSFLFPKLLCGCSGRRLHWLFGQWIRTSCPLTVLFCTHVTELEQQIHVCICARSGALIASAIRLSLHLHPTRPLQGATLVSVVRTRCAESTEGG